MFRFREARRNMNLSTRLSSRNPSTCPTSLKFNTSSAGFRRGGKLEPLDLGRLELR